MAPIPPVSAARSVSARMRSLSWTAKLRRRGRADNSGDAAAGAGTTVGLRPPFAPSPAAASICLGSMGMTDDPSAPPSLNSRGKMSHLHWHGGVHLYDANQLAELGISQATANAHAEVVCGAVGAEAQHALDLQGRDAFLAGQHHMDDTEPAAQPDVAVGEDGIHRDGEAIAARRALVALPVEGAERV